MFFYTRKICAPLAKPWVRLSLQVLVPGQNKATAGFPLYPSRGSSDGAAAACKIHEPLPAPVAVRKKARIWRRGLLSKMISTGYYYFTGAALELPLFILSLLTGRPSAYLPSPNLYLPICGPAGIMLPTGITSSGL